MADPTDGMTDEQKRLFYRSLSSQGARVTFSGTEVGMLLSATYSAGSASPVDIGGLTTKSEGGDPFVVPVYDVTTVTPGSLSVTFIGPKSNLKIGRRGLLQVQVGNGTGAVTYSGEAHVTEYQVEATVGEFLRGSASFAMTGR